MTSTQRVRECALTVAFPVCRSDTLQAHDPLLRRALCVEAAATAVVVAVAVAVVEVEVAVAVVAVVEIVAQ
eukprot:2790252-Prymnesium_polylepis.1